ncbi:MAG: glutathione S-transferase family protein [Phenylobacterium sp.]|nr:glutathione S-transferase family protein [Phenylobacterium sp.]
MITLYGAGEGFGLPEISPYVMKTEVQLKMAGLAYRKVQGRREDSPKGQLPYIDLGGKRVADSTFIRGYLERSFGLDLDAGLDTRGRAEAWAIERMVENQLNWVAAHAIWLDADNFAKGPAHFFDDAPEGVAEAIRRDVQQKVRETVFVVGVGRHSEPEIVALGLRSLAALSAILGDSRYLMGDRPCGADATMFGMLAYVLTPFFDSELRRQAEAFGNLTAYVERMMAEFYPAFAWAKQAGEPAFAA